MTWRRRREPQSERGSIDADMMQRIIQLHEEVRDRLAQVTDLTHTVAELKSLNHALLAELTVSSPDLGFPSGHSWPVKLYPRTNIVTISLAARESGDFPLTVTLAARNGFVVASGDITIRSTAISGVAVALSIGAAVFLVVWWLRSILSKRRKKHKLRGAALAAEAIPGSPAGA